MASHCSAQTPAATPPMELLMLMLMNQQRGTSLPGPRSDDERAVEFEDISGVFDDDGLLVLDLPVYWKSMAEQLCDFDVRYDHQVPSPVSIDLIFQAPVSEEAAR